ncbi:MAG TPA: cobalamin-binding protein [Acholeplasmataceae bacterium]|jgi:5-methyltetrahydrofolate--homocysteine methyltransferase|nr:cobalamin-binding protein [Acholeplasmataceae bacterium]
MNFKELASLVEFGKAKEVEESVKNMLEDGLNPHDILNEGLLPGMNEVGQKWKNGKVFIPEVLIAARALNTGMKLLQERLANANTSLGKIVLGTVKGDMHDIGKNLVGMMLKSKGFNVIDLGTNVDSKGFIEAAKKHDAKFVCMSALLTTTMLYFKTVIEDFEKEGLRDKVIILGGGAPVTEEFSKSVGCDYYANDAVSCAELIYNLVKGA